ncbi:LpxI family protein, partial [Methylobacterium sp. WL18]
AAGCVGLALEAGGTLVIDRAATAAEADRLGLFLVGYGAAP